MTPLRVISTGLLSLGWKERIQICIGAVRGLDYINENATIHHDVNSSNLLLNENRSAKVANFGLSKLVTEIEQTHMTTNMKDSEYALTQKLRDTSDVYSFGVVLFEVLCAKKVIDLSLPSEMANLPKWALEWERKRQIEEVGDPYLIRKIRPLSLGTFAPEIRVM